MAASEVPSEVAESLKEKGFTIHRMMAYRGKKGCRSVICSRVSSVSDSCYGWHCPTCHEPTCSYGHDCPQENDE